MKIYMERTLNAILENKPDTMPQLQEKLAGLEQKSVNKELYFINHEQE